MSKYKSPVKFQLVTRVVAEFEEEVSDDAAIGGATGKQWVVLAESTRPLVGGGVKVAISEVVKNNV